MNCEELTHSFPTSSTARCQWIFVSRPKLLSWSVLIASVIWRSHAKFVGILVTLQSEQPNLRVPTGFEARLLARVRSQQANLDILDLTSQAFAALARRAY